MYSGQIFVFGNTTGHLYSIDTATSSSVRVSESSISSSNIDGATCINSNIPIVGASIALVKTGVLSQDGKSVSYTFEVRNTGDVPLDPVTVTDPKIPGGIQLVSSILEPGGSTTGTAVYTVTEAERGEGFVENQALATGTPPTGTAVTDLSGTDQGNDSPTSFIYQNVPTGLNVLRIAKQ